MTDDALEEPEQDELVEEREEFGTPHALALVAFVLAVVSLAGFGLMNGTTYVLPLLTAEPQNTRLVLGALLGAALALVPIALGWTALSHSLPDDERWVATVARAAVILGSVSMVLRLVVAVVQAAQDGPTGFTRL